MLLFALWTFVACSSAAKKPDMNTGPATTIEIRNENFLNMTLYVFRGNERFRLGVVPSQNSRVFKIPDDVVQGMSMLRFLADPIGGRSTPIREEIPVVPGERNKLIIRDFQ